MEYCPVAKEFWNLLQCHNYDDNQYGLSNQPSKLKFFWIWESCVSFAEKCRSLFPETCKATSEVQTGSHQLPTQQQTEKHCHNFDPAKRFSLVPLSKSKPQITLDDWLEVGLTSSLHGVMMISALSFPENKFLKIYRKRISHGGQIASWKLTLSTQKERY